MYIKKIVILSIIAAVNITAIIFAFQNIFSLQQSLYAVSIKDLDKLPELIGTKFQLAYFFVAIAFILTLLTFVYFAFIDISKEFKLSIENKRAKEAEIVASEIDLGELQEEIKESDIIKQKNKKFADILAKIKAIIDNIELPLKEKGEHILSLISREIEIVQGELFLKSSKTDTDYELIATYAYYIPEEQKMDFVEGEGLLGQVAKGQKPLNLKNLPQGYLAITSGLGQSSNAHLMIQPLINQNQTIGVIELASFKEFNTEQEEFLENLCRNLGMVFASIVGQNNNDKQKIKVRESIDESKDTILQIEDTIDELESNSDELKDNQEMQ